MVSQITKNALTAFCKLSVSGIDAGKFLQGQLTCDIKKRQNHLNYQATAISNLKGRVDFGVWVKQIDEQLFDLIVSADCAKALQAHLKKYGAFSKCDISDPEEVFACVIDGLPTFSQDKVLQANLLEQNIAWQKVSIATGNAWIVQSTQGLFQPQELRLHQRGGVDYDKGCYLGQEVIARIYFKSAPKAFLHRVAGVGKLPQAGDTIGKIQVVNAIDVSQDVITDLDNHQAHLASFEALVIARPDEIANSDLTILALPDELQKEIGRLKE